MNEEIEYLEISEIGVLRESLEDKTKKAENYYGQLLSLKAEFENYIKRTKKEQETIAQYSKSDLLAKIFPVLDGFEKAIPAIEKSEDKKAVLNGIKMMYKSLVNSLGEQGLEKIDALGKQFDPNYHQAVMVRETKEKKDNEIIEEIQSGYMINEKVVRPSMVIVAKNETDKGKSK